MRSNRVSFTMVRMMVVCVWACGIPSVVYAAAPLKVVMISGSAEYETSQFLPQFKEYLEDRYNIKATLLQSNDTDQPGNFIPGLEAIKDGDVLFTFTRRLEIDGEQLQLIKDYVLSGKPIVAIRTASHGYQKFLEMDKEVLGGNYHGHFGGSAQGELDAPTQRAEPTDAAKTHPVMQGIGRLKSRYSLYKTAPTADDVTVLMYSEIPADKLEKEEKDDPRQPAVWVREYKGARIFYSSLGGMRDFQNDTYKRMIAQALFWTAKRDVEAVPLPEPPKRNRKTGTFSLKLRSRLQPFKGAEEWQEVAVPAELKVEETAIVICDMWDKHWCDGATQRVGTMVPKMNDLLKKAREKGILILHCPSECMDYYADSPQRRRVMMAPKVELPQHLELPQPPLPIDDSDGGCDSGQKPWYMAWTQQHPGLEIGEFDGITDNGDEAYNYLRQEGINTILMMGVHTNMCVLGRGFATRPMTERGMKVILVRDLTDAMYNPEKRPFVSHEDGTELVVQYIERNYGPSVTSSQIMKALD